MENAGVVPEQRELGLKEFFGLQADADFVLRQPGPALVATSGRIVVK